MGEWWNTLGVNQNRPERKLRSLFCSMNNWGCIHIPLFSIVRCLEMWSSAFQDSCFSSITLCVLRISRCTQYTFRFPRRNERLGLRASSSVPGQKPSVSSHTRCVPTADAGFWKKKSLDMLSFTFLTSSINDLMEQNKERSFPSGRFWFTPSVFHHSPINNDRVAKSYYLIVETDF